MTDDAIAGVLLAAGAGSRFGSDKLGATLNGETLLRHSALAMLGAGLSPVLAVLRPGSAPPLPEPVEPVINDRWYSGMASSVQTGLAALAKHPHLRGAIIAPADQPRCGYAVYLRLVDTFRKAGHAIVIASFNGEMRNPVLLARDQWGLAEAIDGDNGLSAVVRSLGPTTVECADIGTIDDVDTMADLERIRRSMNQPESAPPRKSAASSAASPQGPPSSAQAGRVGSAPPTRSRPA